MRTALICQPDRAGVEILPAWLASFSELTAIVVISEPRSAVLRRLRTEARRSHLRLLDVLAFRAYYRVRFARGDARVIMAREDSLAERLGPPPAGIPVLRTSNVNSLPVREFLKRAQPDVTLARCKTLLAPSIFEVPKHGTFVVHPGVCPEYRNAHGCFWALARRDLDHVGSTLLRIDAGVDTGPVIGHYTAAYDDVRDTHVVIQHAMVLGNLDRIAADLRAYVDGTREPVDVTGRQSRVWGQPRLSDWRRWKVAARRRVRVGASRPGEGVA
jgi:hypothetical protein